MHRSHRSLRHNKVQQVPTYIDIKMFQVVLLRVHSYVTGLLNMLLQCLMYVLSCAIRLNKEPQTPKHILSLNIINILKSMQGGSMVQV